jgi:hypothetical protein
MPEGHGRHQVDRSAQSVFKIEFETHEPIEGGWAIESDQYIDVAYRLFFAARDGTEDAEGHDAEPTAQGLHLGREPI